MPTPREPIPVQRPYCLRCYAALDKTRQATVACESCRCINVMADQRLYWTQEPSLIEVEFFVKVGIGFVLAGMYWLMLRGMRMQFGTGQGYAIGGVIVIGAVLWETAAKITRRKLYFRATLFWNAVPAVIALPLVVGTLWPSREVPMTGRAIVAAIALVLFSFSLAAHRIGGRIERWKSERIRRGQLAR